MFRQGVYQIYTKCIPRSDQVYTKFLPLTTSWMYLRTWTDIPTAVDFILEKTKQDKLYYIGHSMGTTMFWVALNEHPNLKDKISLMVGMGPVAKVKYMKSPLRFLSPFVHEVEV